MKVCNREIRVQGRLLRVARLEGDGYEFLDDPASVIEGLRKSGTRVDLFTFTQQLPETEPKFSYPMEWDNFAALPVSTFDLWWTKQIDNKTRNMARKAEKKDVVIREVPFDDRLVRGIWEVYNECPVRQGRRFRHYGKDRETVHKEEATFLDHSTFIGAFLGEQMIGFIKLTTNDARTQAGLMNIVSMVRHRDKAPTNALIAGAVRFCAERGIPYLVYASFAYGNKQRDSIIDFKKNNGFRQIDVPRYFVPLTAVGSGALRLGLHRRLADRIPEAILARLRDVRSSWYRRKLQSVPEVLA
jgi:hypothetical protein